MPFRDSGHIPDDVWQQFWDGELSEAEAARVTAHQAVCPACRQAGGEWQQLFSAVDSLPDEHPSAAETTALVGHVGARIRRQRRWHGLAALLAAIAFVPLLLEAVARSASLWQWLTGRLGGSIWFSGDSVRCANRLRRDRRSGSGSRGERRHDRRGDGAKRGNP